ncbi:hypothetical protein ADK34_18260 [Streptomyces viridochromogenes]|uniref:Secreted protein n=1 Tax=Streptomyces viridochromogenes TaxID=1938 RepID=A0A0L8KG27_STRVR|nr:hypothetical protein ADK34_18260 [Streptomyces viridochromogenes]
MSSAIVIVLRLSVSMMIRASAPCASSREAQVCRRSCARFRQGCLGSGMEGARTRVPTDGIRMTPPRRRIEVPSASFRRVRKQRVAETRCYGGCFPPRVM